MAFADKDFLGYCAPRIAGRRVGRRIAWEARRIDEGHPGHIRVGLSVAVGVAGADRSVWPPENIVVFGIHRGDQAVVDGHVKQRESAVAFGERLALCSARLTYRLVPYTSRAGGGKPRHVGSILRPRGAVELADHLYLVVGLTVLVAGERGWRTRTELVPFPDGERRQVAPMEKDTPSRGTERWCWLPLTRIGRGRHVEFRHRRAITGAVGDHRCGSGLTDGDTVVFGLTVGDRGE